MAQLVLASDPEPNPPLIHSSVFPMPEVIELVRVTSTKFAMRSPDPGTVPPAAHITIQSVLDSATAFGGCESATGRVAS